MSVIIPARDEERDIERTVRAFLAQTWQALEIIVVNDRSSDATGAILERLREEDSRLTVIEGVEPPAGWLGKPAALHRGSLSAHGEWLAFVDADVVYQPEVLEAVVAELEDHQVEMVTLLPHFEMRGFWEHVLMPNLAMFVFTFVPLWLSNRTRSRVLAVGGGTGNIVSRSAYDAAGGHEALRDAVIDDVGLARLMRREGFRTRVVRADRLVSVRMYHGLGEIVRGFTKNAFAIVDRSYVLALSGAIVIAVGNLLPFALAATGSRLAMATVAVIVITRVILFRSFRYGLANAVLAHPLMIASWLFILFRSVWYTGIRRQLHWRGRTYEADKTRFGAD